MPGYGHCGGGGKGGGGRLPPIRVGKPSLRPRVGKPMPRPRTWARPVLRSRPPTSKKGWKALFATTGWKALAKMDIDSSSTKPWKAFWVNPCPGSSDYAGGGNAGSWGGPDYQQGRLHWLNVRKPRCRPVSRPKRRHKGWKALVATGSWKAHLEELSSSSSSNKG